MKHTSKSVRIVTDAGQVVEVNPDLDGNHEPVTLTAAEDAQMSPVTVRLDGASADALADAIDEARGRKPRRRGGRGDDEQTPVRDA